MLLLLGRGGVAVAGAGAAGGTGGSARSGAAGSARLFLGEDAMAIGAAAQQEAGGDEGKSEK